MKLELSIPIRPRLIHLLAVLDLLALVFLFPLLVNQVAPAGGYELTLPKSPLRLPAQDHAVEVKVKSADEKIEVWVNNQSVTISELPSILEDVSNNWIHGGEPIAWLKQDKLITVEQSNLVLNILYKHGFRVLVVGEYYNAKEQRE